MKKRKKMDIKEFVKKGYLQEANRLFFHPLGLALSVTVDRDKDTYELNGILDSRDDPEGFLFILESSEIEDCKRKANFIKSEIDKREDKRIEVVGSIIQPIEELKDG